MITELYLKKENPIGNWAYAMLSQLYVALPFALLNVLAFQNSPETSSVTYNPHPAAFHIRIHLAERYGCLLCGFSDRKTSPVRAHFA